MDEVRKSIITCHTMLDMIRIRKNTSASVEALKDDLGISRSTADNLYKKLTGSKDGPPLVVREKRGSRILGERGYFLGVSIGSKHIRAVLLDLNFDPVPRAQMEKSAALKQIPQIDGYLEKESDPYSYAFLSSGDDKFLDIRRMVIRLVELFLKWASQEHAPLMGIGFALAGPVDYEAQVWRSAPHITDIRNITLPDVIGHELLRQAAGLDLFLSMDNNAKASIVSEYQYLLEKNGGDYQEDVALIYIGSGVGSAAVLDQKLLRGSHNLSGELGHIRIEGAPIEKFLTDPDKHPQYIPLVLNTVNCLLGIDRFILVGHDIRSNATLIPSLMDQRLLFTVTSTQQYCKAEPGRGQASTAAIGAAMEAYFSMCGYNPQSPSQNRINLAKEISWRPVRQPQNMYSE